MASPPPPPPPGVLIRFHSNKDNVYNYLIQIKWTTKREREKRKHNNLLR